MEYKRPDLAALKEQIQALTKELQAAESYEAAKAVFLKKEELEKHISTQSTLAEIRHTIDTRDEFYDGEVRFWNGAQPQLEEDLQQWTMAMLASPFRKDFTAEYGDLMFVNAEIQLKTFSPEIMGDIQQENDLTQEYEKLLASAQIPFEGKNYTISQMSPFKTDPDDARRLAAWKAEGQWYKDNQAALDDIYDKLVHLRDQMGKKLGYEGYTTLGYYRMGRNCYTKEDVEKFRAAVRTYLVPLADSIYREQAKRLGKEYPMSFADNALEFRSGNPRPVGTPDDILAQGKRFYDELSPETSKFFRTMLDGELLDVLSTEGKAGGGYCTSIPDYRVPFIFANFNGTQHDVEVVTHEAGHAFAAYTNRDRVPMSYTWPSLEACEVHSMSMEFFAWPWQLCTVTLVHFAEDLKALNADTDAIRSIADGAMCQFSSPLHFQQLDGLKTVLPFGCRKIQALRTLTSREPCGADALPGAGDYGQGRHLLRCQQHLPESDSGEQGAAAEPQCLCAGRPWLRQVVLREGAACLFDAGNRG